MMCRDDGLFGFIDVGVDLGGGGGIKNRHFLEDAAAYKRQAAG